MTMKYDDKDVISDIALSLLYYIPDKWNDRYEEFGLCLPIVQESNGLNTSEKITIYINKKQYHQLIEIKQNIG